jgi:hypothetical protein
MAHIALVGPGQIHLHLQTGPRLRHPLGRLLDQLPPGPFTWTLRHCDFIFFFEYRSNSFTLTRIWRDADGGNTTSWKYAPRHARRGDSPVSPDARVAEAAGYHRSHTGVGTSARALRSHESERVHGLDAGIVRRWRASVNGRAPQCRGHHGEVV